jgi:hypothetical protein
VSLALRLPLALSVAEWWPPLLLEPRLALSLDESLSASVSLSPDWLLRLEKRQVLFFHPHRNNLRRLLFLPKSLASNNLKCACLAPSNHTAVNGPSGQLIDLLSLDQPGMEKAKCLMKIID